MIIHGRSLKLYIPLLISLTLLPLGMGLMWQLYQSSHEQITKHNLHSFKSESLRLQRNIERYFRLSLPEDIEREIAIIMSNPQMSYAVLVGRDGRIQYATDFALKGRLFTEIKKLKKIDLFTKSKQPVFIESHDSKKIYAILPITTQNRPSELRSFEQSKLYMAYDDTIQLEQLNENYQWRALAFAFGILMIMVILIIMLRKLINEPIEVLNTFIAKVQLENQQEEGDKVESLGIEGKGELSSMAQKLNSMHAQIKHSKYFIKESNAILAGMVKNTPLKQSLESIILMYEKDVSGLRASILLRKGNHLHHGAAPSLPDEYCQAIDGVKIGPNVGSCGTAAFLAKRVIVSDIATDPRWEPYKELALPHQLCACWSEPIINLQGNVLGTFAMYYDSIKTPNEQDLATISAGASLALLAIEHDQQASQLKKLNDALLQAGESIMVTDNNGVIEYVNEAFTKATQYLPEEVIGHNPRILQSDKQSDAFYQRMWTSILTTGEWRGDLWNKRKGGEIYPERLHIRAMKDANERIINYVGTFSDISEQKAVEEAFRQTQKMEALGTLVGGVAHNFNNILAGITGTLYLARQVGSTDEVKPYLDSIDSLSWQAADIIAQLMAFSHQDHQQFSKLNLSDILKEAYSTSKLGIPEDIQLNADFSDEKLFVHGNSAQLQQVLMNLITNARDAVKKSKKRSISVSLHSCDQAQQHKLDDQLCSSHSGLACLKVEDSGTGMDEETLTQVFDPFFTTKEVGEGTGLGLSMSIGTIEQFGGKIEVKSTRHGGSVFSVYLPLVEPPSETSSSEPEVTQEKGHEQLILVVDDEDIVRDMMYELLTVFGYQVITAEDGKKALEIYQKQPNNFALLLTDLVMPNMNGRELAKEIRRTSPTIPIIFASGYDMKLLDMDMIGFEDAAFMTKPIDIHKLRHLIASYI
ncbi:MAG: response regulator [Mariprofundaceae bacterium]|nr:response regulator [Mariprofundaceae bacterium]